MIIMKKNIYNVYHIPMVKIWNGYKKQQMKNSIFYLNPSMLPKFVIKNIAKYLSFATFHSKSFSFFAAKKV